MFFEAGNEKNTFTTTISTARFSHDIKPLDFFDLSYQEALPKKEGIEIPLSVFRHGESGLKAITKYLKEQKNLNYSDIAKALNRNPRTIWSSYDKTSKKPLVYEPSKTINTTVLADRNLSVLEAVAVHLKKEGLSLKEISLELDKSPKTIWTVLERAKKKGGVMLQ